MIKIIVAVDRGNAIGWEDGRLPWKLALDMKRFKELTTGHIVVMGRKTWLSLNRPTGLPNRKNIVLNRRPYMEVGENFPASSDIDVISSLDYVKQLEKSAAARDKDIWIIGGKSVYEEALAKGMIDEIHVTLVDATSGADVVLNTDLTAWKLFVLRQRELGMHWEPELGTSQRDGDFNTTYLTLRRT